MKVLHLDHCPLSDRNGTYGGAAGQKEGIWIDGQYWMVKYPKRIAPPQGGAAFYTAAPLSEYIGSHIYAILGYETQETLLGLRNGRVVVACKDFCARPGALREIRALKNVYSKELAAMLKTHARPAGGERAAELQEMLIHLQYNPILSAVPGLAERFWDCAVIDSFIGNCNRGDGNWGLLYEAGRYRLAPIYGNGGAFFSDVPDGSLEKALAGGAQPASSAPEQADGAAALLPIAMQYPAFRQTLMKNVPLIQARLGQIQAMLAAIPERQNGLAVCTPARRQLCERAMQLRLERLLLPALRQAAE